MFGTEEPQLLALTPAMAEWADAVGRTIRVGRLRADVAKLPGPRNRLHFADAMLQADHVIMEALRDSGWAAERRPFAALRSGLSLTGANIVAVKPGESSHEAVVIGAHHDTVSESPGADDNGSGVAALLELARVLTPFRFRSSIVLAALDMEELGFLGAEALLAQLQERLQGAIIFEMLGYTGRGPGSQLVPPGVGLLYPRQLARVRRRSFVGDFTTVIYNGPATGLARCFGEGLVHIAGADACLLLRGPNDIPVIGQALSVVLPFVRNFARSDHVVFWEAGIPAIQVTDTADFRNPHYHRPTDTLETLDYDRIAAIVGATAVVVARTAVQVG